MKTKDPIVRLMIAGALCIIIACGFGVYAVWHFVTKYW